MSQNGEAPLKARLEVPVLFVDVDGVISVFGFPHGAPPPGRMHSVEGIPHCIGNGCGERLLRLAERFELVWATGWEERANEHLPHLLGLPSHLPTLRFRETPIWGEAHWKLSEIAAYASSRPAAWIDDSFDESCFLWAESRREPTLLVQTDPAVGMTDEHVDELLDWATRTGTASRG
jgi:HAD domain in Swiss Army Knife RNA repair proteins